MASAGYAQTGGHGYGVAGGTFEGCGGCPPGPSEDRFALFGGGYAYPLMKGRLWIEGDLTLLESEGYFEASGGPSAVIGLGSLKRQRVEPFAEVGPRWGDGGDPWWNVGAGMNAWVTPRVGIRVEYQFQWTSAVFSAPGPGGVIPSGNIDITPYRHLIRLGFAFRATPSPRR